jgi:hypothetical protein
VQNEEQRREKTKNKGAKGTTADAVGKRIRRTSDKVHANINAFFFEFGRFRFDFKPKSGSAISVPSLLLSSI